MKRYAAYLFDMDGVLYRGLIAIPGAGDALRTLCDRGAAIRFLTNNSGTHRDQYTGRLEGYDIPCEPGWVMTSAYAAAQYLHSKHAEGQSAYVVGEPGLVREIAAAGLEILDRETFSRAQYVIAGIDHEFTYAKMFRAQQAILHGAAFIATNRDATYPVENGLTPGAGAIVESIAIASGVEPLVIGKPQPYMFETLLREIGVTPDHALMIGDRLDTDILGGNRSGIDTALVLTGVNTREEGEMAPAEMKPMYIIDSLQELL